MEPSSSFPETPPPRKTFARLPRIIPVLATILLVAVFGAVLVGRGIGNTPRQASGPAVTPTPSLGTFADGTSTPSASATRAPGATPSPTSSAGNSGPQTGAVRVTRNQDERQLCADDPKSYTVVLFNGGNVTANWHVYVPAVTGAVASGPNASSQSPVRPLSSYPYWADPSPQDGSVAPGQTASFVMNMRWTMPCGGTLYKAAVQLRFPAGTSQADIPLTFGGTGPARYSNVVLASGSLNVTQPCPASGAAPDPFTFAIKNTGNYKAYPYVVVPETGPGGNYWADVQYVADPQAPDSHWLYPGETWTFTASPVAGLSCGGASYSFELRVNNAQGTTSSMTFTDTFN
jgi:hypothetical protein